MIILDLYDHNRIVCFQLVWINSSYTFHFLLQWIRFGFNMFNLCFLKVCLVSASLMRLLIDRRWRRGVEMSSNSEPLECRPSFYDLLYAISVWWKQTHMRYGMENSLLPRIICHWHALYYSVDHLCVWILVMYMYVSEITPSLKHLSDCNSIQIMSYWISPEISDYEKWGHLSSLFIW